MKKFYTLALAASIALTASAVEKQAISTTKVLDNQIEFSTESVKSHALKVNAKAVANATATATPAEIAGEYFLLFSNDNVAAHSGVTTIEPADKDNTVTLKEFIFSDSEEVTATLSHDTDYDVDLLSIEPGTPLFSMDGSTYCMYVFFYNENGQASVSPTDPIQFLVTPYGLICAYENTGIAYIDSQMYGSWIMNPMLCKPNGTMSFEYIDLTSSPVTFTPYELPVFAEYQDGLMGIFNFAGTPNMVLFQVDTQTGKATASSQVVYSSSAEGDFILYDGGDNFDPDNSVAIIDATLSNLGNGKSKLVIDTPYWWAYSESGYYLLAGTEGAIELNFDIPTLPNSGVNNINVDNSNAPVEYFNLQGVRVQNPENGLYIRRQGTEVTKVLVK